MGIFLLILFIVFVYGGWFIAKSVGSALFGKEEEKENYTYIDKSIHYHEHKHVNIIDDKTKEDIIVYQKEKEIK